MVPGLTILEIRLHFDNFINSALDYDPEISVFFSSDGSGGGSCDSDEYEVKEDVFFWLSVSSVIVAIYLSIIVVLFFSTGRGKKIFRGSSASISRSARGSVKITHYDEDVEMNI